MFGSTPISPKRLLEALWTAAAARHPVCDLGVLAVLVLSLEA
jgi:hypothetical protein